jgi:hypothetical protein
MVLYIPFTFGNNGDRKGVTEQQIFWHMRNARIGHIDHIDCKEWTDKKGVNVRSWFVHFSKWSGSAELSEALDNGGHFEIDYDDFGHYWKVMKYTPRDTTDNEKRNVSIRIVKHDQKVERNVSTQFEGVEVQEGEVNKLYFLFLF